MANELPIQLTRHPTYVDDWSDFCKFRLAYKGGRRFIDQYMRKLSVREDDEDYATRKELAYCPRFAAAAINDIKNSIYQRTVDVVRAEGPTSYQRACRGELGGVDLALSTMNSFMGATVLEELLVIRRVGILTDNPDNLGVTLADKGDKHPYLGIYKGETILNWQYTLLESDRVLKAVLLEETVDTLSDWDLPLASNLRYRLMQLVDQGVKVTFFDSEGQILNQTILKLKRIPFTIIEIPVSLMQDVVDYQIALMNLESTDISFARVANFPVLYEFFDPKGELSHKKRGPADNTGENADQNRAKEVEAKLGLTRGRRYPMGAEAPGFINPSPDTMRVSMEKGKQLKDDIRLLVNLNLSNIHPTRSSAESKGMDMQGLESSLSYIGLMLQKAENEIAYHWAAFEGGNAAKVIYPRSYNLKTDSERYAEADAIGKLMHKVPSNEFKRQLGIKLARILISTDVNDKTWDKIKGEVETAISMTTEPNEIIADVENGLVSKDLASKLRGYPDGEADKAFEDQVNLVESTLKAQMQFSPNPTVPGEARGGPAGLGPTSSQEKQGKAQRGEGKKVVTDG